MGGEIWEGIGGTLMKNISTTISWSWSNDHMVIEDYCIAMYHRFSNRFKTWDIPYIPSKFSARKNLRYHLRAQIRWTWGRRYKSFVLRSIQNLWYKQLKICHKAIFRCPINGLFANMDNSNLINGPPLNRIFLVKFFDYWQRNRANLGGKYD